MIDKPEYTINAPSLRNVEKNAFGEICDSLNHKSICSLFDIHRFVRHCLANCKLSHNPHALYLSGGMVAQEIDARRFYGTSRLEPC